MRTELLRAALPAIPGVNLLPGIRKTTSDLDSLVATRDQVEIERAHVDAYAAVCDYPTKDCAPLPYVHILAFPLHLQVISDPRFPFAALGAVHIANSITAHRPLSIGSRVDISVRPENLTTHPKGRTIDLVASVTNDDEVVWESRSTYLHRERVEASEATAGEGGHEVVPGGVTWRLPADLGRRYAAVSGDHNPIHLYPLTAKALGFRRQIAHGMWSAARCLAAIENRLPDAVRVDVEFKKPIFLPSNVAFGVRRHLADHAFALTDPKSGAPHVLGRTQPG